MKTCLTVGLLLAATTLCPAFLEASGQTKPFTLTAGARAGWDAPIPSAGETPAVIPQQPGLSVHPNPVSGAATIRLSGVKGEAKVALFNIAGAKVCELDCTNRAAARISSGLPNGLYFARLIMNGRSVKTARFLVVR